MKNKIDSQTTQIRRQAFREIPSGKTCLCTIRRAKAKEIQSPIFSFWVESEALALNLQKEFNDWNKGLFELDCVRAFEDPAFFARIDKQWARPAGSRLVADIIRNRIFEMNSLQEVLDAGCIHSGIESEVKARLLALAQEISDLAAK